MRNVKTFPETEKPNAASNVLDMFSAYIKNWDGTNLKNKGPSMTMSPPQPDSSGLRLENTPPSNLGGAVGGNIPKGRNKSLQTAIDEFVEWLCVTIVAYGKVAVLLGLTSILFAIKKAINDQNEMQTVLSLIGSVSMVWSVFEVIEAYTGLPFKKLFAVYFKKLFPKKKPSRTKTTQKTTEEGSGESSSRPLSS